MLFDPNVLADVHILPVSMCPLCGGTERDAFELLPRADDVIHAVTCRTCGFIYMDGRVAPGDIARLYTGYTARGEEKDVDMRNAMYKLDHAYAQCFIDSDGAAILDIGCGEGKFLEFFKDAKKYGVEIDRDALSAGRAKHPDIQFYESTDSIPAGQRFGIILFRGTLQYMPDLAHISAFCREHSTDSGKIIILALPNADSLLAQIQREHWGLFSKIEHSYCFGINQVQRLFKDAFEMIAFDLPYLGTPYEHYIEDYKKVVAMFGDPEALKQKVPFFGSMISIVLRKVS